MLKSFILLSFFSSVYSMTCSEIHGVYQQSNCCTGGGSTCLKAIPLCSEVNNGIVCFDGSNTVVKGLLEVLDLLQVRNVDGVPSLEVTGNIVFSVDNAYDIGEVDKTVRNLHLKNHENGHITIIGPNPYYLIQNSAYIEEGARCYDANGDYVDGSIEVVGNTPNQYASCDTEFLVGFNCYIVNAIQVVKTVIIKC